MDFIILEKKIFKRATKNPNANVGARPDTSHFQLAFHIYNVKYENTLTCKRMSWGGGGGGGGQSTGSALKTIVLSDLILYIPSTIFQLCRDGPSWVEPVLSYD